MKKITFLIFITLITMATLAQSRATSVSYNKETRPAIMLELPYTEEIAEGTIVQKLKEIGYDPETKGALFWKKNTLDGYYVFKDVALRDMNGETVDLYFKVNRKSRKEKDQSTITLLVGKGENRFISSETDSRIFESASQFLNGFTTHSAAYKLNADIEAQQLLFKGAEAKYNRLQDEEKSLVRKIRELEQDLKQNRENQEAQKRVIETERQKLEELKAKS